MKTDKLKSLYIDCPIWNPDVSVDDFIVAIGVNKSNSIYHVAEVRKKPYHKKRKNRFHLKVYVSDLLTLIKRDSIQTLYTMTWYKRNKK